MALLDVKDIHKSFGGIKAIQGFSIQAEAGEIHGIIGPNGAGKTTIFNVISGVYTADQGSVMLQGKDITKTEQHIPRKGPGGRPGGAVQALSHSGRAERPVCWHPVRR